MKNKNFSWKIDNFDTSIFGFRTAKISTLDSIYTHDLIVDLDKNKVKYSIIRIDADNFELIHALENSGFLLVDGLISLSIDLSFISVFSEDPEIVEAKSNDVPELKTITSDLYTQTRVTNDPITKKFARNYYEKWIENSVKGKAADSVLIFREKNEILGYVTLQKSGKIPLIGIVEKARGKGLAKKLLKASFLKFKEWSLSEVIIETQIFNFQALRAYQKAGFKIVNTQLTFRWVTR